MLSIITPNLNNDKYLEGNILSISKLNVPFEHIVVDGGSTDDSLEIIKKYPHIKLLHQRVNNGMYGAIDQGIMESTGEYIAYINADDRIISSNFKMVYEIIMTLKYNVIYSDGDYYFSNDDKLKFGKGRRFGKFFLKNGIMPAIQPSIIFSRKTYDEVGGLRYDKFKICGDLDLFIRIARITKIKFKYIPKKTVVFMKRGDSLGDLNEKTFLKELKDNNLPKPNFLIRILYFIFKYI